MYHIKNDLRSKASAEKIYQSIRHLLLKKEINQITITDIKNECGISRSTFYRNYDNIMDPLIMKFDYFVQEYLRNVIYEHDHILYFYTFWDKHSDFIVLLVKQGYNFIILNAFEKYTESSNEYSVAVKCSIMSTLLTCWVKNNKKESIEEMKKLTENIFKSKYPIF